MPYPATPTFWLEPANTAIIGLRRYRSTTKPTLPCSRDGRTYHDALIDIDAAPIGRKLHADGASTWAIPSYIYPSHDDPRWPTHCECGYEFEPDDEWQDWYEPQYRRVDSGELTTIRRASPGAMWDALWYPVKGPDGLCLVVRCPNGHDWMVDSEASNCTRKGDQSHKCWIRHGDPRTQPVTVDKNGDTCAAGAGSIVAGDYHGFLQNGVLTAG